jgi:hypothetical protein
VRGEARFRRGAGAAGAGGRQRRRLRAGGGRPRAARRGRPVRDAPGGRAADSAGIDELAALLPIARREARRAGGDPALAAPNTRCSRAPRRRARDAVRGDADDRVWILAASSAAPRRAGRRRRRDRGRHRRHVGRQGAPPGHAVGQPARGAGGLGGLLIAAGDALVRGRAPGALGGALWTLACAPLVVYDALRAVLRPRAARIPAHGADLAASSWPAAAGVRAGCTVYVRLGAAPRGALARRWRWSAIGPDAANRCVLPRLYGWFHARCRC